MAVVREYEVKPYRENFLEVPHYGTKFSIEYIDNLTKHRCQVPITASADSDVFHAVFPIDDVDFEIIVDNKTSKRKDFCFDLELHKKTYEFVESKMTTAKLATIESLGGKFHFLSQTGKKGRDFVTEAALKFGISHQEASVMVGRLKFKELQFGKILSICYEDENCPRKTMIQVFVKTFQGKTIKLDVSAFEKIDAVEKMIEDREGIPAAEQCLVYTKSKLMKNHRLSCYRIGDGATLIMSGRGLMGGMDKVQPERSSAFSTFSSVMKKGFFGNFIDPDASDPGVICYGSKSDQKFMLAHVLRDDSVKIKPFVIEMRKASEIALP